MRDASLVDGWAAFPPIDGITIRRSLPDQGPIDRSGMVRSHGPPGREFHGPRRLAGTVGLVFHRRQRKQGIHPDPELDRMAAGGASRPARWSCWPGPIPGGTSWPRPPGCRSAASGRAWSASGWHGLCPGSSRNPGCRRQKPREQNYAINPLANLMHAGVLRYFPSADGAFYFGCGPASGVMTTDLSPMTFQTDPGLGLTARVQEPGSANFSWPR